ncbi:MAG: endoglucanase [Lachnospiraceae bacterium]|nr:endoglucanase [Lachnospiraceae bacterium]
MADIKNIPYKYNNIPIHAGGYVTGFCFHSKEAGCMYLRTDIGGVYRYNSTKDQFESLGNHIGLANIEESYPIAIALDEKISSRLYIICGVSRNRHGLFCVSKDRGESFTYSEIPTMVDGNWGGRSSGSRLIIDPNDSDTLYFASQRGGLLVTHDLGQTWNKLNVCGEDWLTFVWMSPFSDVMIVGSAGVDNRVSDTMRGHGLYVSYDRGASFSKLPMPESQEYPFSNFSGYVPVRCTYDGKYFYVTLSENGPNSFLYENGYGCDSGHVVGGHVLRYYFKNGRIEGYKDITPAETVFKLADPSGKNVTEDNFHRNYCFAFGGITSSATEQGLVVCTTVCRPSGDCVLLSRNYGETWNVVLYNTKIGSIKFNTSYMRPEYYGNRSCVHWMSDIKINPLDPQEAWFNTGTGVFRTYDLLSEDEVHFEDWNIGLENTVHLNIYAPLKGPTVLLDAVGDLGGFAFTDITKQCKNSFADADGNKFITCLNIDSPDEKPEIVYASARGNWAGKTKGGIIRSTDYGMTFERLETPFGLSPVIDKLLTRIELPNINSGWIAVNCEGTALCWCLADRARLPVNAVICSRDSGKTWEKSQVIGLNDLPKQEGFIKVFADKCDAHIMYGFGDRAQIYISKDFGKTFRELPLPNYFPRTDFSQIDTFNKTEIRCESGKRGVIYIAMNYNGLWKLQYNKYTGTLDLNRLTKAGDACFRVGFGLIHRGVDYLTENKALYVCAVLNGKYGFYRSFNDGTTWECINNDHQMFGEINSIDGDKRVFGRFYIGTGTRGLLYGEPEYLESRISRDNSNKEA